VVMVRLWSRGQGFESRLFRFTQWLWASCPHSCLYHQAVWFDISEGQRCPVARKVSNRCNIERQWQVYTHLRLVVWRKVVSALASVNEVNLHRTRLVLR